MSLRLLVLAALACCLATACPRDDVAQVPDASLGETCGGYAGTRCGGNLWCDLEGGQCDYADVAGVCVTVPEICTKDYRPVCGCDGKTYGNDCDRMAARAQLDHPGECEKP